MTADLTKSSVATKARPRQRASAIRPSSHDCVSIYDVVVEPSGLRFPAAEGDTLVQAATKAGIRWPGVCGGLAECGVCAVEMHNAVAFSAAPTSLETSMLRRLRPRKDAVGCLRLACQLRIMSDLVVFKIGVRKPTD